MNYLNITQTAFRNIVALFLCLFAVMLSACGGGGGGADSSAVDTPASIEITPNAVILTQMGQQKALSVRVLNAQGRDITASVGAPQWESSHPEQISVNGAGVISASGAGGSGQITARLGELRSAPLLAVHTLVPLGAVLLSDAQIVGEPEESTPGAAPSFANNTYRVRLTGLAAPLVGELLINTESKAVAGRVRAVQSAGGVHAVTLGLVSVREMFPHLAINEVIDLSQAEVIIPAAVTAQFDVVRTGSSFTFTPKVPGADLPLLHVQARAQALLSKNGTPTPVQARVAQPVGTSASGPVGECKFAVDGASGAGSLPISVLPTEPFSVDINPTLQIVTTSENGLERLVLHTEPTISAGLEFKVLFAFEGKVTCDLELFIFRLPVAGPLGLFVGGLVPVGIGAELGGKFTFFDMALGISLHTTFPNGAHSSNKVHETLQTNPQRFCTRIAVTFPA